jgi:hypothetical protein
MKTVVNTVEIDLKGGKEMEVKEGEFVNDTLKEGEKVQVFKSDDLVTFEFSEPKQKEGETRIKHFPGKTHVAKVHTVDAQIMEKLGKGKIVK